jgi:hypothetical protein
MLKSSGCYKHSDSPFHTVIHFVSTSAKFGTCTVLSVNGTLVEDKMRTFKGECPHFSFNKCPIYTHDGSSAKYSTNSHEKSRSRSCSSGSRSRSRSCSLGSRSRSRSCSRGRRSRSRSCSRGRRSRSRFLLPWEKIPFRVLFPWEEVPFKVLFLWEEIPFQDLLPWEEVPPSPSKDHRYNNLKFFRLFV